MGWIPGNNDPGAAGRQPIAGLLAPIFQTTNGMTNFPRSPRASLSRSRPLPTGVPVRARSASLRPAVALLLLFVLGATGCRLERDQDRQPAGEISLGPSDEAASQAGPGLVPTLRAATALADSVEDLLRPVPLMRPADEEALRQYSNAANVRVARQLGVRPANDAELQAAIDDGRLIRLEDSTEHWVLRSGIQPYVTPDTYALLERLGDAFQDRLEEMGLPRFRYEISSVLRTASGQAALRRTNPNAAAGTSAHEFGTTVDIVYEAYPAPAELPEGLVASEGTESPEEAAALERVARVVIERMAARKSREMQAILGEVMRAAQSRGEVLVTLERQQPVYHITLARGS